MLKRKFLLSEFLFGVIAVFLGIYTIVNPFETLGNLTYLFGIFAIVNGIANIFYYFMSEKETKSFVSIITGVIEIAIGIFLMFNYNIGKFTITILFPIWFIIHCIGRLVDLYHRRHFRNFLFYLNIIIYTIGIFLGIMMILNPFTSAVSAAYLTAIYLFVAGTGSLVTSFINIVKSKGD